MTQRNTEDIFLPLLEREQWLGTEIIDIAISIHKSLGPGLLESVYEECFCYELEKRGLPFTRQHSIDIYYDNLVIQKGLRIDILVDDLVIIELKAQEVSLPIWSAQLLSYLKLTNKRLGYILNFHIPLMKNGIKRIIL